MKVTVIPVSCVESGRWHYRSPDFRTSGDAEFYEGRSAKAAEVSAAMLQGRRHSDQSRVWNAIADKMVRMEASSPSSEMAAIYHRHHKSLQDYTQKFPAGVDQVGAAFALGERMVGVEFFDTPATFRKLFPKILRSYAIDAMEAQDGKESPHQREAVGLLNQVAETEIERYPAVGMGEDLRVAGDNLAGGGLALADDVIHFAAFVR
jgi:hypothetical protein